MNLWIQSQNRFSQDYETAGLLLLVLFAFVINVAAKDTQSYANLSAIRVPHVDLDWDVLFDQKILQGTSTLTIERTSQTEPLILGTRDLKIDESKRLSNALQYTLATCQRRADNLVARSDGEKGMP